MVCSSWREIQLGDLIDIEHGFAFRGEYFSEDDGPDILLTPGNFAIGGGFKSDKFKYYDGPVPEEYVLQKGDLVITMTDLSKQGDTLGYPALIPERIEGKRFLHNQRLGRVVVKKQAVVTKNFLLCLLRTPQYRHEVLASATGTTVKHTSPKRIKSFSFELPPLPEQKVIAHILGSLDDKIELNRRMNETLEAMARAIFKSWFVDFDPVVAKVEGRKTAGMSAETAKLFPDSFEDSELGKIPRGWRVGRVGDCFNLTMGQSPPGRTYNEAGEGIPFFQGRRDFGFRHPSLRVYCTAPTRYAEAGDTLVSVRAPVGDINMASQRCCVGRGVAAARHKSGSRSYTYYMMHHLGDVFARFEAEGTVFGSITKTGFRDIECIIPPEDSVGYFERMAYSIDQEIELNERQSATLASVRDALLPKLLSGEIRVKKAQKYVREVN